MNDSENNRLLKKISATLDKVRPFLQEDGGDIELISLTDDYVVKVRLTGACSECRYSMQTLKAGVEQALLVEVPEIVEVLAV